MWFIIQQFLVYFVYVKYYVKHIHASFFFPKHKIKERTKTKLFPKNAFDNLNYKRNYIYFMKF
jgi:hypothetical protein